VDGFTKQYAVKRLVWYEMHSEVTAAITREKQLKKWNRKWKIELIQKQNPYWRDLFETFTA
jgi:putative endonuclease